MRAHLLTLVASCVLGSGCAVGPDFRRPEAPSDRAFTAEPAQAATGGHGQRVVQGEVQSDWWRLLRCEAVDAMVSRALAANPGVEAARATLAQNDELMRAGYGVFFPQLSVSAGASRELYNPAPGAIPLSNTFNLFTMSGSVSYTIDLWGGERRQVEALGAAVDAQRYALASARMMLASNVVDAVVARAAYQAEVEATRATLVVLRAQVRIASAQATGGTVPYSNVLSLESQAASTEATLPALEEKIDQAEDLLAALSGSTPASWRQAAVTLDDLHLPESVPVSVPSLLVRQRPDVLIAEAQLHAANAEIGVATAAMLPNLTLSASYGFGNTSPADLFSSNSPAWALGAGLTQPVFRGGALAHQRQAAVDARDASAASYRQVVLQAFEQVADTLRALGHDGDAAAAQTEAVETAEKALTLTQANYAAGIATYLQVLVADTQYLQARTGYVQAVAQRLQDTVALYVALGGGWWNAPAKGATG